MKESQMNDLFGSIGIGFPQSETELYSFNRLYEDYIFEATEEVIDPVEILNSIKTITKTDYHKRIVLAAEIVYQLQNEKTIGHLKLQKLMYLCQHTSNMSLHTNFLKQAMGPYDPSLMRSIDKKLFENKWFNYVQGDFPQYKPLENAGGHKTWFNRYFSKDISSIDNLIQIFRRARGEQIELVATIYACCLDAKQRKQIVSEELIIQKVFAWSENKAKFSVDRIKAAHSWMKERGIYPC